MEYTLREYTDKEYRADLKKLLEEKGLHDAVKDYCDKINEEVGNTSYITHRSVQEYMCTILDLINMKHEPHMVNYSGDGYSDGKLVYDLAECPNCGYDYEESDYIWKEPFCPHCGQALKWEIAENGDTDK